MEKNCLVTTYKASVDDNSLLKIGEMLFDSGIDETNVGKYITFSSFPAVIETLDGSNSLSFDKTFATGLTNKIVFNGGRAFYVKDQNVLLRIHDKYNVNNINCPGFIVNLDDLKYCSNLNELMVNNLNGSFESIKALPITKLDGRVKQSNNISSLSALTSLTHLALRETNVSGDISSISGLTNLTNITFEHNQIQGNVSSLSGLTKLTSININYTQVTGDISSLTSLTNLTSLMAVNCSISGDISSFGALTNFTYFNCPQTQLSGEIIDYVISQRSHGRSTGKTRFIVPMSVTFNGQGVTKANISWTASTITNETTSETINR